VDRYLASLRASSPTYEDPYAYWGGTRPALQYGLPPEQPRPAAGGFTMPLPDYSYGHVPAGMPAMGAPPPVNTGPGGPRPSTPSGTILPGGGGGEYTFADPAAQQRYTGWRAAADALGAGLNLTPDERQALRDMAAGGIAWAGRNEPGRAAWAQDPAAAGAPDNTLNPQQALSYLMRLRQHGLTWGQVRGRAGGPFQGSGRADAGGNATDLTSVTPAGAGAPEDAGGYMADWRDRAAAHITQAVTGGTTGGATGGTTGGTAMPDQRDPTYHATPNNQGATGVPATGAGGGLPDVNAAYLLDPQNRAALQAYIAQRGGVSPSTHSLLGNYIYDTVAPMFSSALTSLGLDTPGGLQGNIDQWFQQGRGNTLFSSLRNAAQQRLGSGGFASDLAALGDPRAQAGLLNQLINLTNTGQSALHRAATQQQLIDRQRQFELQSALSQDPTQLGNYMQYFQGLPGWDRLVGGGG
jgi:hypothetical protein